MTAARITDAGLATWKPLQGLKSLHLTGTRVTGPGILGFEAASPDTDTDIDADLLPAVARGTASTP